MPTIFVIMFKTCSISEDFSGKVIKTRKKERRAKERKRKSSKNVHFLPNTCDTPTYKFRYLLIPFLFIITPITTDY